MEKARISTEAKLEEFRIATDARTAAIQADGEKRRISTEAKIEEVRISTEAKIQSAKYDLVKWIYPALVAQLGLYIALTKLLE